MGRGVNLGVAGGGGVRGAAGGGGTATLSSWGENLLL